MEAERQKVCEECEKTAAMLRAVCSNELAEVRLYIAGLDLRTEDDSRKAEAAALMLNRVELGVSKACEALFSASDKNL